MNTEHTCHESAGRMQFQRRMSPSKKNGTNYVILFLVWRATVTITSMYSKGFLPLGVTIENPVCPTDISSIFSLHVKET